MRRTAPHREPESARRSRGASRSRPAGNREPALQFLVLVVLCLCSGAPFTPLRAEDGDLIELRPYDEVYFKDSTVIKGTISETDNPGEYRIKDIRTGAARPFTMDMAREVKRRATVETELARLQKQDAGQPGRILRVAQEAMRRFGGPTDKLIAMLEKEAGSKLPDLLALLCQLYLQTGQLAPALKTSETLIGVAPGQARGYLLRGQAQLASGNLEAAEKDLDKAFQLAPEDQEVIVSYADYFLRSGRPEKARELFASALAKNPKNVAALVGKGMVCLRQGEFSEAEQSLKEALLIDGKQKQAQLGLAAVKAMTGRTEDAYREAESVLNVDNRCAEAIGLQAFAKLFAGDRESLGVFAAKLKDALNERPNQPRLVLASAAALEREAKLDEAQNTPEALSAAKQKRDEAAARYAEVLASDPPDAYLQYFIGERKFRAGEFAGADTAFQRAARLAPSYAPVHAAVGAVSLRLSKWDAARDAFAQAIKLDPKVGEYHAGKGLSLLKAKRFEEASPAFNEALSFDRNNVTALCGKGYIANFEKNKNSAIGFFQQALAADGACDYAADALNSIYKQENMSLEYLTFSDNQVPGAWRVRAGGTVKPSVLNGRVVFTGVQGASAAGKIELCKDIRAEDFVRLEADLEILPESAVTFGLRLASASVVAVNFEVEFGKDETTEIKVRFKDFGGQPEIWQGLKTEWPADGRARLGMDTDELRAGDTKMRLWINGRKVAELSLKLQKLARLSAGVFVQPSRKEAVQAVVDNIVLVVRGSPALEKDLPDAIKLLKEDEKKAPPPLPPPGEKKAEPERKPDAAK